jgi:hypothetical protein
MLRPSPDRLPLSVVVAFIHALRVSFRSRAVLQAENHRPASSAPRPPTLTAATAASRTCRPCPVGLAVAHLARLAYGDRARKARNGSRLASARLSTVLGVESRRRAGRPGMSAETRLLIRRMSEANPLWGAPRIHGELLKLGIASVRRPWRNTCRVDDGRRHHTGGPFSPRMPRRSSPATSSSCQR